MRRRRFDGDWQAGRRAISEGVPPKSLPDILVFDSGLGGLTVFGEIFAARPQAHYRYVADDAVFPYGELPGEAVVARVREVLAPQIAARPPDVLVIACNTASTLVLGPLRADYPHIPVIGTVPAVKPAAERSQSKLISVLATPGTVARDYTRDLVRSFAGHCEVELVGARDLAAMAEAFVRGEPVDDAAITREIAACFVERDGGRRTDHVVLACTHFPLLLQKLRALAPWPVEWVDPAPAIARQVERMLAGRGFARADAQAAPLAPPFAGQALFTGTGAPSAALAQALARLSLAPIQTAARRTP